MGEVLRPSPMCPLSIVHRRSGYVLPLAVKDGQISRLQDALDAAQETAKAAQVLHAQERRAIESAGQKSRWRRLRDAWRG